MRWTPSPVSAGGVVPDVSTQFPPRVLREYSFIADGERGALIGPRGDIAWMCAPRWHDDAVFSTLIGGGGIYAVTPDVDRAVWGGYYESGSLIWRSHWATGDAGIVESRDARLARRRALRARAAVRDRTRSACSGPGRARR